MNITEILDRPNVCVSLRATDKTAAITELVDLLHANGHLSNRDEALSAVLSREQTRSTGIGLGLAVPHGKTHGCAKLAMAFGKPAAPMEFDSVDGRPVVALALLISPVDQTGPHIQALAHVSRLWQAEGFREAVHEAADATTLYAAIKQFA